MRQTWLVALALCGCAAIGGAGAGEGAGEGAAAAPPGIPEFSADYRLTRNGWSAARLTRTLQCDDGQCSFRSQGETVGFADLLLRGRIEEVTRFRFDRDGIHPRDYAYRQQARGDNDEHVRLFFSPRSGVVRSRGDDEWQATVDGEVVDELLSQLRLMLAVRAGEREMEFTVIEGDGERDSYRFRVVGRETVETGAGAFEAVKVERVRDSQKRRTEMWFATQLEFIPVVVRQERVGEETYTATLQSLTDPPRMYRPAP